MAVVSSKCIKNGFSFGDRKLRHRATFEVWTDDRSDAGMYVAVEARSATPDPVPAPLASFALFGSADANAFCQSINADQPDPVHAARKWLIDCEWYPLENPEDDWTEADDPLTRPLRYNVEEEDVQEIVEFGYPDVALPNIGRDADEYGPIVTAAGGTPGTPLIKARKIQVLVIVKNFATLAEIITLQQAFVDKLNSGTFYGAPAGKALVRSIIASEEMVAGTDTERTTYREATFRIAFYEKGFDFEMVNRGFEYLHPKTGSPAGPEDYEKRQHTTTDGTLTTDTILLELDGTKTAAGDLGTTINWRTSEKVDFDAMGIGGGA